MRPRWVNMVPAMITVFFLGIGMPSGVGAAGFALLFHGAGETAMAGAAVAHVEGPAANFYNPALLADLPGKSLELSGSFIRPSGKFISSTTGRVDSRENKDFFVPAIFGGLQAGDRLTAGVGIFSSFGLGTYWPEEWEGRYLATDSELITIHVNPNLAWKVTDRLTVAGGLDFLHGDATLASRLNLSAFGLADGRQEISGNGTAWGGNLGLLYRFSDHWAAGLSYRSAMDLDIEGDLTITLPPNTPPAVAALLPSTPAETVLKLPAQGFFGLAFAPTERLLLEAGGIWQGWSRFKEIRIELAQPVAGQQTIVQEKGWRDSLVYNLGLKYQLLPAIAVSAGYMYMETPVPAATLEPSLIGADVHLLTLGLQKRVDFKRLPGRGIFALSYLHEFIANRGKDNQVGAATGTTANGLYKQDLHSINLSATWLY